MKLFMLTVKHFLKLKWSELAKDEISDEWIKVGVILLMWTLTIINALMLILINPYQMYAEMLMPVFGSLVFGFTLSIIELMLFVLILIPLYEWISDNWSEAKYRARRELRGE